MKKFFFVLLFLLSFSLTNRINATGFLDNITNSLSKEYEEYTDPQMLYEEMLKEFLDGNYGSASLKAEKIIKFHPFFNKVKQITTIEVLSNYLDKSYEKNEAIIDNYVELNEGDEEIFYLLYMKALSWRKMIKSSQKNLGIAKNSLDLFRLLKKKIEVEKGKETLKISKKLKNLLRFEEKINQYTHELEEIMAKSNFEVEEYYYESGNYIAALNRDLFAIENLDDIFSSEDKEKALKNVRKIFKKIYNY